MAESPESSQRTRSSRHRPQGSLVTSASGFADSTISFSTYATGITDGSLCLSQFPPPPTTFSTPSLASPAQSNFTITASTPMRMGFPSPAESTFTVTAPVPASAVSRVPSSIVQPGLIADHRMVSPARSTFPVAPQAPVSTTRTIPAVPIAQPMPPAVNRNPSYDSLPSDKPGKTVYPQHSVPSGKEESQQNLTALFMAGRMSPFDWHEGSSIISVDPTEERMLSTSFITGLLSSANPVKASGLTSAPQTPQTPYQPEVGTPVSEMSYPPSSPRYYERLAGPTHFPSPNMYPSRSAEEEEPEPSITCESEAVTSYEAHANLIQSGPTKLSVVGMSPATVHHFSHTSSMPGFMPPQSPDTMTSKPYPPSVFSSVIGRMQSLDIQPLVPTSQPLTSATPLDSELGASNRLSAKLQRRGSVYSTRTVKSHVSSLISSAGQRTARAMRATKDWLRIKPLPPIPTIPNVSLYQEREHRRMEDAVPLPQLAERAERLNTMLNSGHLSRDSIGSSSSGLYSEKVLPLGTRASGVQVALGGRRRQSVAFGVPQPGVPDGPLKSKSLFKRPISRNAVIKLRIAIVILVLLVIVGVVVGVVMGREHSRSSKCPANRTGNTCSLNSTCVCIPSGTSQCNHLAQSLVDLTPIVNGQLNANFTPAIVVDAMSISHAFMNDNDCAAQAQVVDVSPALDSHTVPNRTHWAQSVLLWTFVLSQNASAVDEIRNFIENAHWKSLSGDGPVTGHSSDFSTTQLGYTFDFAAQTLSEPSVSFVEDGQPSNPQLAEVNGVALAALNRMYTFASASSTLRSTALSDYWQYVLQQDLMNLPSFVSQLISSPVLLPFDATETTGNRPISSLMTNSTSAPFPPPLACYPGLTQSQLELITKVETSIFGLSSPSAQTNFNDPCFADRPVYGVLDALRLRLPFRDSQTGLAKQAAVLSREASPRVVIYNGQVLSGLPDSDTTSIPTTDPRRFGTLNHINHVLLDFFEAIPDVNVATQFVDYVLSSPATPPSNDTLLGQSLNVIPTLEAAVFGSITPPDVVGVVSSFTTPSGRLFFGTDQSLAVREWAIAGTKTSVTWTQFSNSPLIVNDNSFTDTAFNAVWVPAFTYFHSHSNAVVNVGNITAGFTAVDKFTSN